MNSCDKFILCEDKNCWILCIPFYRDGCTFMFWFTDIVWELAAFECLNDSLFKEGCDVSKILSIDLLWSDDSANLYDSSGKFNFWKKF